MGKIFVSAGHGGFEGTFRNPGAIAFGTTEAAELIVTRDLIVSELRARDITVESPDDDLSHGKTIDWINAKGSSQDIALEIQMGAFDNPELRGTTAYYIAINDERMTQAQMMITALISRIRELPSRGAKPDTAAALGRLAFCRDVIPLSLQMELGFITNIQDLRLLQTRRRDYAIAIADGLQSWLKQVTLSEPEAIYIPPVHQPPRSFEVAPVTSADTLLKSKLVVTFDSTAASENSKIYPQIDIQLNGQKQTLQGIIVSGNAYVPEPLLDCLGVAIAQTADIPRIRYEGTIYLQAIGFRDLNISVAWDATMRIVMLKTVMKVCIGEIDRIMGYGNTSIEQLSKFLKQHNETALDKYKRLVHFYVEEAQIEAVNHDIAFCQMCVETGFLRFGGNLKPNYNNFAALKTTGDAAKSAQFPEPRIGVRAQIQRLKAYASTAPLVMPVVDPAFATAPRGTAQVLSELTQYWSTDPDYDRKIVTILRLLYESAGLL